MTGREFREHLQRRAAHARVDVPSSVLDRLELFVRLLAKWNGRINLTSLSLDPLTDETIDRLILEPLAASTLVPNEPVVWCDLGTGGGSPALPLKLVRPLASLTMVESKGRKVAFLREAVRALAIDDAVVEAARFQDVTSRFHGVAQFVTVRALCVDAALIAAADEILIPGGRLFLFEGERSSSVEMAGFEPVGSYPLTGSSILTVHRRVPRGTY